MSYFFRIQQHQLNDLNLILSIYNQLKPHVILGPTHTLNNQQNEYMIFFIPSKTDNYFLSLNYANKLKYIFQLQFIFNHFVIARKTHENYSNNFYYICNQYCYDENIKPCFVDSVIFTQPLKKDKQKNEDKKEDSLEEEDKQIQSSKLQFNRNTVITLQLNNHQKRFISFSHVSPTKIQANIIKTIYMKYLESYPRNALTILLHGPPGTGKSTIPYFLASLYQNSFNNGFKSTLCFSYDPTSPTRLNELVTMNTDKDLNIMPIENFKFIDNLLNSNKEDNAWHRLPQGKKLPNVYCIEEFDQIFNQFINQKNFSLSSCFSDTYLSDFRTKIDVYDKITWNKLLDDFHMGFYQNSILFLTTNRTPKEIENEFDESLIRKNRVDLVFELNEIIE